MIISSLIELIFIVFLLILLLVLYKQQKKNKEEFEIEKTKINDNLTKKNNENEQLLLINKQLNNQRNNLEIEIAKSNEHITDLKLKNDDLLKDIDNLISKTQQKEMFLEEKQKKILLQQEEFNEYVNKEQYKLGEINQEISVEKSKLQEDKFNFMLEKENFEKLAEKKLMELTNMSEEEAIATVFNNIKIAKREEINKLLVNFEHELQLNKKEIANGIIIDALETIDTDSVNSSFSKTIKLPSDDLKGRLIGREGRTLNLLENLLGINILIDDTPGEFTISTFNYVRRAIASIVFERLISSGKINQATVEETVSKVQNEIADFILQKGKEAVDLFNITDMDIALIEKLGSLYFRSSYNQNVYKHSIEVAKIARNIASQLHLDEILAARCGLLHDIGKADSEELGISHVELGAMYAQNANEPIEVVNTILSHHGDIEPDNYYAIIATLADQISASQIGVRNDSYDSYVQRISEMENLAKEVKGVKKAYGLKGGKEIRLIVDAGIIKDDMLKAVGQEIKEKIENNMVLPSNVIINVIRENRYLSTAKTKSKKE